MASLVHFEGWDEQADGSAGNATRGTAGPSTNLLNRKLIDSLTFAGQTYSTTTVHHAHTGSAALRITNPAGGSYWIAECSGTSGQAVGHVAFRFDVLPNNDQALMRFSDNTATQVGHDIQVRTTGQMRISIGGLNGSDAGAITTGIWYVLEAKVDVTTTTHGITWKVYPAGSPGSPTIAERLDTKTGQGDSTVFSTRVGFGSVATTSLDLFLDDWLVSETVADYPLGESYVKAYVATGKGTHADGGVFQNFSGASVTNASPQNSHQDIDDTPANTATGVAQTANGTLNYLDYTMSSVAETGSAMAVRLLGSFFPLSTAVSQADLFLFESSLNSASMVFDPSAVANSQEWHCSLYRAKPSGGIWTSTALQNTHIRFGYSGTTANPPRLNDLYLTAAFPLTNDTAVVGGSVASTATAFGGTAAATGTVALTGGSVASTGQAFGGTVNIGGGSTSVSAPSLTAVDSGTLEILVGTANGVTSFTPQPSVGWTEKTDISQNMATTLNDQTIFVEYRVVSAGPTGSAIGTLGASTAWSAMNLLVTPSPVSLTVTNPDSDLAIGGNPGDPYAVIGIATAPAPVAVTVNGISTPVGAGGDFSYLLALSLGPNPIVVTATETVGAHRSVTVNRLLTVSLPDSGSGGGPSEPVPLSDDMLRIQKIIKESGLDPR